MILTIFLQGDHSLVCFATKLKFPCKKDHINHVDKFLAFSTPAPTKVNFWATPIPNLFLCVAFNEVPKVCFQKSLIGNQVNCANWKKKWINKEKKKTIREISAHLDRVSRSGFCWIFEIFFFSFANWLRLPIKDWL